MKIKNIEKAAERIRKAAENKEQIIIFADSDLDGTASAVVLKETIDNLLGRNHLKTAVFFPKRREEGYGLNEKALEMIVSQFKEGGLLVTLDCGITNFEEIKKAKGSGFSVIVVDHHQPIGGLPEADIVVDPKQKEDEHVFKEYANAGITFKLAEEILKDEMPSLLRESFLELTALATISDMMSETEDNKEFIIQGLANIENSERPALKALFSFVNIKDFNSKRDWISKVNSALNSSKMEGHVMAAYSFLVESDPNKAKTMAEELLEDSERKHREISALIDEISRKSLNGSLIFEGSPDWNIEYLGAVASRLCNHFEKPIFLHQRYEEFSRGTVRTPKGVDAIKAMESCKDLLRTFGGHPPAAGFTVKNENLEKFKKCLLDYFDGLK
ncbi:MAG: DHH family phosphoesterase [Candidatus Pacebacteria bacterium]|nr:DHH family phosphoesterase [Candidatus Paceibacterota bacterium]